MKNQIIIQKNTSCQFPIFISEDFKELNTFLASIKKEHNKELLFAGNTDKIPSELKDVIHSLCYEILSVNDNDIKQIFTQSVEEQKILVWLPTEDHACVKKLNDFSHKGFQYLLIPASPISQITCEYIYDIWSEKAVELFPLGIYLSHTIWTESETENYLAGVAGVLRKGIQENAAFYEWFLGNMYEVFDKDSDFLTLLLEKNADLFQRRLDKKTAAARCIPHFGSMFENCIASSCKELHKADVISMACLMHAYLAWGNKILSMEEFYEIRDMFVAFDMGISETSAKAEVLLEKLKEDESLYSYKSFTDFPYLSKIGKIITGIIPSEKELLDAAMAVYFDEEALD